MKETIKKQFAGIGMHVYYCDTGMHVYSSVSN